jgi:hypothetical protein
MTVWAKKNALRDFISTEGAAIPENRRYFFSVIK